MQCLYLFDILISAWRDFTFLAFSFVRFFSSNLFPWFFYNLFAFYLSFRLHFNIVKPEETFVKVTSFLNLAMFFSQ